MFPRTWFLGARMGMQAAGLISGPALNSSDFSALKDFRIRELFACNSGAEFFNAFNQVNFSNPTTAVNSGALRTNSERRRSSHHPVRHEAALVKPVWSDFGCSCY